MVANTKHKTQKLSIVVAMHWLLPCITLHKYIACISETGKVNHIQISYRLFMLARCERRLSISYCAGSGYNIRVNDMCLVSRLHFTLWYPNISWIIFCLNNIIEVQKISSFSAQILRKHFVKIASMCFVFIVLGYACETNHWVNWYTMQCMKSWLLNGNWWMMACVSVVFFAEEKYSY